MSFCLFRCNKQTLSLPICLSLCPSFSPFPMYKTLSLYLLLVIHAFSHILCSGLSHSYAFSVSRSPSISIVLSPSFRFTSPSLSLCLFLILLLSLSLSHFLTVHCFSLLASLCPSYFPFHSPSVRAVTSFLSPFFSPSLFFQRDVEELAGKP